MSPRQPHQFRQFNTMQDYAWILLLIYIYILGPSYAFATYDSKDGHYTTLPLRDDTDWMMDEYMMVDDVWIIDSCLMVNNDTLIDENLMMDADLMGWHICYCPEVGVLLTKDSALLKDSGKDSYVPKTSPAITANIEAASVFTIIVDQSSHNQSGLNSNSKLSKSNFVHIYPDYLINFNFKPVNGIACVVVAPTGSLLFVGLNCSPGYTTYLLNQVSI